VGVSRRAGRRQSTEAPSKALSKALSACPGQEWVQEWGVGVNVGKAGTRDTATRLEKKEKNNQGCHSLDNIFPPVAVRSRSHSSHITLLLLFTPVVRRCCWLNLRPRRHGNQSRTRSVCTALRYQLSPNRYCLEHLQGQDLAQRISDHLALA
jgi:hypothetical protein